MDNFQRGSLFFISPPRCYMCSSNNTSELPLEVLQAVQDFNLDKIKDYIENDNDVNALYDEECLLSKACADGYVDLVKLLLQCPEIHLNILYKNKTPLMRAAHNGHLECMRLLLDSSVSCVVEIDKCWNSVVKALLLQMQPDLEYRSALNILIFACNQGHWDAIKIILTDHHFMKDELYPLIMKAVDQDRWDIVNKIFKKDFYGKHELIAEVFAIAVRMRLWQEVEELIKKMDKEVKVNVPFVESALGGRMNEAELTMAKNDFDVQTLNGNLLVVAAGGTTESVALLLMTIKNTYTKKTLNDALFLAALGDCGEMCICLLNNKEASYSIKDLYQANGILTYHSNCEPRKGYLLKYFEHYINKFQETKLSKLIH